MGKYLARWGFTARKPTRRAYEQDPAAVRRWLRRDYPAIAARAKAEGGAVFWGDETGLRSDDVRGRSYAPRGRTPQVRVRRKRTSLGLISALTNRGELRWMVLDGAVKAPTLIRFLGRLVRDARRKVFLILDRLQAHRARLTRDWLADHRSEIEVHYLPPYSPQLVWGQSCQALDAITSPRSSKLNTRRSEGSSPSDAAIPAAPLYSVDRADPNHDAVIRIGGEAPGRRAHSQPRHGGHVPGRVAATSDRYRRPSGEVLRLPELCIAACLE